MPGSVSPQTRIAPLAPGQNSLAAIFTLTSNRDLQAFNASQVPADLAARISVSTLARVDRQLLNHALGVSRLQLYPFPASADVSQGIRDRLSSLEEAAAHPPALDPERAPLGVEEDDDDYEPDYYAAEDTEQILNKLDSAPPDKDVTKAQAASLALGVFRLPPPPPLGHEIAVKAGQGTIARLFSVMQVLDEAAAKKTSAGLNRLAARSYDRDSWVTVAARLATRPSAGPTDVPVKSEDQAVIPAEGSGGLDNLIREALFAYVLDDFRKRIEVAVAWLCEEWYNDKTQTLYRTGPPSHYSKWSLRLIDGFLPYLHPQDKVLTRFLGEIPELSPAIMGRVKSLCRDPSLVSLALTSLLYLVMMRPPVRGLALDTVQDIWTECTLRSFVPPPPREIVSC